jgi:aminobutyraldehyde dehydrogenase
MAEVSSLKVGGPAAGDEVETGPLVSRAHRDSVVGFIDRACVEGSARRHRRSPSEGDGCVVLPTSPVDVPQGAECTREEIFGPVMRVGTFRDEEDAVSLVWTEDARQAADVPGRLDFGTVSVNDHLMLATQMSWGGFKASGCGGDLSTYALDDYAHTDHVMVNKTRAGARSIGQQS